MPDSPDNSAARRAGIIKSTSGEFLRYGFKKTSMDDLARAAGLSRQGLYLHFPNKEELFKQTVLQMVEQTRSAGQASLDREEVRVEDRLLGAFEALHGDAIGRDSDQMSELMATAADLVGPVLKDLETRLLSDVARVLRTAGVAARWKDAGISAKDLADQLCATSLGLKQRAATPEEYRRGMLLAIQMVCRGAPRR
jgi:AcrR family transcriptional regulator